MNLIFIFFGIFFLLIGGQFIVRASVALSFRLNLSKFVIGMTVVSFATSLPELIVSISAALNNSPSIAVNKVIGSNIANIGLILGLISVLGNITVDNNFYKRDWPWMFFISIALWLFLVNDKLLSGYEGFILIIILSNFIFVLLKKSDSKKTIKDVDEKLSIVSNFKIITWLIISSFSLYYGAVFLIEGAVNLAKHTNISVAVISVTILAIGTSLPELAASLMAISKKEQGIFVGNLIGSNIYNIGSVLGITAMIKEIPIAEEIILRDILWMLIFVALIMVLSLLLKKGKISKFKGLIMLVAYFVFIFQALA